MASPGSPKPSDPDLSRADSGWFGAKQETEADKIRKERLKLKYSEPKPRAVNNLRILGREISLHEVLYVPDNLDLPPENVMQISAHGKAWKTVCRRSLTCFSIESKLRLQLLWLVEWGVFDMFILCVILFNSLLIAIQDYSDLPPYQRSVNIIGEKLDLGFTIIFTIECTCKILAYGLFFGRNAYLRDGWNWLDFVVVVSGLLQLAMTSLGVDFRFLRVFRVMRPLRSLTMVPEMKKIVTTVFLSVPRLGNVLAMTMFLMTIFGILGISFFRGITYRVCRSEENPVYSSAADAAGIMHPCWDFPLDPDLEGRLCGGMYLCENAPNKCKSAFRDQSEFFWPHFHLPDAKPGAPEAAWPTCWVQQQGADCDEERANGIAQWCTDPKQMTSKESFNFGVTTFDNLIIAMVVIFQSITMEGWTDVMYMMQDAKNGTFAACYFVLLIFLGSMFLLNVALAVVGEAFNMIEAQEEEERERAEKRRRQRDLFVRKLLQRKADASKVVYMVNDGDEAEGSAEAPAKQDEKKKKMTRAETMEVFEGFWVDCAPVRFMYAVAESDWFQNTIMFFIVVNVVVMMFESYPPPPPGIANASKYANYVFTGVFALEFVVLHVAQGPKYYWTHMLTIFDGLIVLSSFVELLFAGGSAVTALRGFRLLRIFKLAKKWTSFRVLLKAMIATIKSMGYFMFVLGLVMFVFALMGMSCFATTFRFMGDDDGNRVQIPGLGPFCGAPGTASVSVIPHILPDDSRNPEYTDCIPRANFDYFFPAFVTCFQVLSGENWNTAMYDGYLATSYIGIAYFLALVCVGQLIFLNLFLAILMDNFGSKKQETEEKEAANNMRNSMMGSSTGVSTAEDEAERLVALQHKVDDEALVKFPRNYSFLIFAPTNPIRTCAQHIVGTKVFDNFILVLICISSLAMAVDDPVIDPTGMQKKILGYMNTFFTCMFVTEMLLKQVATGVFFGKKAYVKSGWNMLDGVVVSVSLIDELGLGAGMSAFKTVRMLRTLRPLRMIAKNPNLKCVVNTLLKSIPELCNLLIVAALFFLIFGLFSVAYFRGKFYDCMVADGGEFSNMDLLEVPTYTPVGVTFDVAPNLHLAQWLCLDVNAASASFGAVWAYAANMTNHPELKVGEPCIDKALLAQISTGGTAEAEWATPAPAATANLRLWHRPSADTPICEVACPASPTMADYLAGKLPPGCPGPLSSSAIPDEKKFGYPPESVPNLKDGLGVLEPKDMPSLKIPGRTKPGPEGLADPVFASWRNAATRWAMPCGDVQLPVGGVDTTVRGCGYRMCGPNPDPLQCDQQCSEDPTEAQLYCTVVCKDSQFTGDKALCGKCKAHCEAACKCWQYCSPGKFDAGNCIEQGGMWVNYLSQSFDNVGAAILTFVEISTTEGWVDVMYAAMDINDFERPPIKNSVEVPAGLFFMVFIFVGSFFMLNLCVGVIVDNFSRMKGVTWEVETNDGWVAYHGEASAAIAEYIKTGRAGGDEEEDDENPVQDEALTISLGIHEYELDIKPEDGTGTQKNMETGKVRPIRAVGGATHFLMTDTQVACQNARIKAGKQNTIFIVTNLHTLPKMRLKLWFLVSNSTFENFIMACILLNTVVMAVSHFPEPQSTAYDLVIIVLNYIFAFIFTVEAVLKLYALRAGYFRDSWNIFDFVCVMATDFGILIQEVFKIKLGSVMSGIRLFRIARLFRLLRFLKGLNQLFVAFLLSIPKLLNVGMIMGLLLFLFSVMGSQFFAKTHLLASADEHANFRDFFSATLTLLRSMTGEGWNEIMHSLGKTATYYGRMGLPCVFDMQVTGATYQSLLERKLIENPIQCGSMSEAVFFMLAYTAVITFVILNLFVAVVLEGFESTGEATEAVILEKCISVWKRFDKDLTLRISVHDSHAFVEAVQSECCGGESRLSVKQAVMVLARIRVDSDEMVGFADCVEASLRLILSSQDNQNEFAVRRKIAQMDELWRRDNGPSADDEPGADAPNVVQHLAAVRMQEIMRRKWRRRRELTEEPGDGSMLLPGQLDSPSPQVAQPLNEEGMPTAG